MNINWFPGHMSKSIRMIEADIKLVDLAIYVLDARAPYSCLNPEFDRLIGSKPVIYVLNKADLGLKSRLDDWTDKLSSSRTVAVTTVGTASGSANAIVVSAKKLCGAKLEKYLNKGVKTTIRAMVIGVPNCGKSTIINCLCRSAKTVTGNRPGVTRGKQWVRVNEYFEVLDTPGTLYPKLSDQKVARRLAYIGSIRDEVVDTTELAMEFMRELKEYDPTIIERRYKADTSLEGEALLEAAARARGLMLKGGVPDTERMAVAVLDDFRKGRLGKITLENVNDFDIGNI